MKSRLQARFSLVLRSTHELPPQAQTIINHWAREAIQHAEHEQLEGGRWFARVSGCPGAVATGETERDVQHELSSVLEEWALLGMQLGDEIPQYGEVDLNAAEARQLTTYRD